MRDCLQLAFLLEGQFRRLGKESTWDLSGAGWGFSQDNRLFSPLLQSSQRFLCVFQGQFSHLEPSQDDGRVATVLRHFGQGKGLYSLQRCFGSKHIPVLEREMVGSPVVRLQTLLAHPPSNLYSPLDSCCWLTFVFVQSWYPVGDRPFSEILLSISSCLHRPESDC